MFTAIWRFIRKRCYICNAKIRTNKGDIFYSRYLCRFCCKAQRHMRNYGG